MTNLTQMIRKSIEIHQDDAEVDAVAFINQASNQQLLRDYVEMLDNQLANKDKEKLITDTILQLRYDFNRHLNYTHQVFEHCYIIAKESMLLNELLVQYLSHKDILYSNLRDVLKAYNDKYEQPLDIDSQLLSMDNITDFEKIVRERIPFIFRMTSQSYSLDIKRALYVYQHLGVLHTTRMLNDDVLGEFIPHLNEVDIHELNHYFSTTSFDYIKRFNYHFSMQRIRMYYESHIADIQSLILWGYDNNDALNYLYDLANDREKEDIIGTLLNLKELKTIPQTMYKLHNGVQTILHIYIVYLLKGDFQTTRNVVSMLEQYLNQLSTHYDNPYAKQYVKQKYVDILQDTLKQYKHLSTIDTSIIDKLNKSDNIIIVNK